MNIYLTISGDYNKIKPPIQSLHRGDSCGEKKITILYFQFILFIRNDKRKQRTSLLVEVPRMLCAVCNVIVLLVTQQVIDVLFQLHFVLLSAMKKGHAYFLDFVDFPRLSYKNRFRNLNATAIVCVFVNTLRQWFIINAHV